jgi:hypothetical protein
VTTDYVDILNYDCNFIIKKKAAGNIEITVYVSVRLTGQDAVMQIYEFTGMPFPVEPGFFYSGTSLSARMWTIFTDL